MMAQGCEASSKYMAPASMVCVSVHNGSTWETLVLTEWVKLSVPTIKQHWQLGVSRSFSSVQLCQHSLPRRVLLLPFYLERQQWEASQCTAERYMKYQVPQWDSYFLGSATYSRNIFLGSFQAVCMFQGYSWRKISKACKNEWLAWTPCLHLGLKILWCFIIVFRLVVRPVAIWSHSCSGHDQILTWSSALNWTGPSCALWLEVKAWPPSFYTPPSTLLLCKMS